MELRRRVVGGEGWRSLISRQLAHVGYSQGSHMAFQQCAKSPKSQSTGFSSGPSCAALASLRVSILETVQGGGEKSWTTSLLCDPEQVTSLL